MKNRRFRWVLVVAGWALFGLFMGLQAYGLAMRAGHPISFMLALRREYVYAAIWCLLTPSILALSKQLPLDSPRWWSNVAGHFVLSFLVAFGHKACYHLVTALIERPAFEWSNSASVFREVFSYIDYGAMVYWIIILMHSSAGYYRKLQEAAVRSARLESQLATAQLQALKMQLQPHFLFNTLNAISVLVQKNPETARRMLLHLSDLLRLTLQKMEQDEIPLKQELDFLQRYLQIEQMRFQDRLQIDVAADADLLEAMVPTMILQPLVENAMRHGIGKQTGEARLRIHAERTNGSLRIAVYDNGPGTSGTIVEGIGISNIRARLEQLYGTHQQIDCANVQGGGFVASVSIPWHTAHQPITAR